MAFTQRFDSDGEGLGAYYDHDMTRLEEQRFNDDRRIVSLTGLLNQVENHLLDRINLQELYSALNITLRSERSPPLFLPLATRSLGSLPPICGGLIRTRVQTFPRINTRRAPSLWGERPRCRRRAL